MQLRTIAGPKVMHRIAPGTTSFQPERFALHPRSRTIGALVEGVDLRQPCDPALHGELASALAEWKVLFFREQHLTAAEQGAFVSLWGDLTDDQLQGSVWSPDPADSVVTFTRDARTVGLENGWHSDGTFRPMPTMGTMLRAIEVPDVGGDTVFADMAAAFDNLIHWEPGSVALWDNLAVQHYGVNDYFPDRRVLARATWFSREHTRLAGYSTPLS